METYNDLVSARIKAARKGLGIRAEDAAKAAEVGLSRWLNWESGLRLPKPDMMPNVAKVLNTTPSYLYGYVDHQGEGSNEWNYMIPNGEKDSTKAFCSDFLAFNVDRLHEKKLHERHILMVRCRDDSLNDDFSAGDIVLINTEKKAVTSPAIFAILDGTGLVWLRRIRPEMTGGYVLYCDDKVNFPDQHFANLDDLNIIGKYLGHWHWDANA
ncbi:XRE family transcriptional regulator [Photobacterium leiognathi]|uniref:XRE family transcriptional regulator n=1 Tax=Photobacterium leiognathi TaxID=553611 RepID=UPI000D15F6C6|nr:LexA family transcriptional regulator [Photobacterium leiognathi]PSW53045.1 hypothetical protein C0W50_19750 [Photobacterium leiognathi subsp. mandapamensis]